MPVKKDLHRENLFDEIAALRRRLDQLERHARGQVLRGDFVVAEGRLGVGTDAPEDRFHSKAIDDFAGLFERTGSVTNAQRQVVKVRHVTDQDMVDGFGAQTGYYFTDSGVTDQVIGVVGFVRDGADNTTYYDIAVPLAGTFYRMRIHPGALNFPERSSDPSDPTEGRWVIWMSDGTGAGDDGDIMIKITAGGSTKTVTLVDFSAA